MLIAKMKRFVVEKGWVGPRGPIYICFQMYYIQVYEGKVSMLSKVYLIFTNTFLG